MKILGIGNALVDVLVPLENDDLLSQIKFPKGSMQLVDEKFKNSLISSLKDIETSLASGGSASNTIHGLAKLNIHSSYIGKISNDELGDFFKSDLIKSNIIPQLLYGKAETGTAITLISQDSERTFATYLGAAIELSPEDLKAEFFNEYDIVHIEGYLVQNHDLILRAVKLAKEADAKVSIDLASFNVVEDNRSFLKEIIVEGIDYLFANEEEAKAFTGKDAEEALEEISENVEIAIVKTGSKGSLIKSGDVTIEVGVIDVNPIDTTGAGDLYASGFLYGLSEELPLHICGQIGATLAGNVIECIGAKMDEQRWNRIKIDIEELKNQ